MKTISQVYFTENIAVVSFETAPANIGFVSSLFDMVAKSGINVDMISQTAPKGISNTISFTIIDTMVADILQIVKILEVKFKSIKPLISVGNVKISLYGDEMPSKIGIAAGAFNLLNENGIDIILITTSDVDISMIVQSSDADLAYETLKNAYLN